MDTKISWLGYSRYSSGSIVSAPHGQGRRQNLNVGWKTNTEFFLEIFRNTMGGANLYGTKVFKIKTIIL